MEESFVRAGLYLSDVERLYASYERRKAILHDVAVAAQERASTNNPPELVDEICNVLRAAEVRSLQLLEEKFISELESLEAALHEKHR